MIHDSQTLHFVTEQYLACFHRILNTMICGMTSAKINESISHNFIVQMIPHHRAAIEMSQNLLCYTTCTPLQKIASGIITEQTKSIRDMKQILGRCSQRRNSPEELSCYQCDIGHIMNTMFEQMETAQPDKNINISFMREMIPHHKCAIAMSSLTLDEPICPSLKPILTSIITSQEKGVKEMEQLLSCLDEEFAP